jgi:hypothetical protein
MVEGHSDYLLGSWVDEGLVYLDLTKHIPDKQTAIEFGLYNRQKAIWDIAKKQAIELDPEAYEGRPLSPRSQLGRISWRRRRGSRIKAVFTFSTTRQITS